MRSLAVRTLALMAILSISPSIQVMAQERPNGHYEGAITIFGQQLIILVDFSSSNDSLLATIDIPQQGAKGLKLTNVQLTLPKIHFELPAGPGLAVFDGTVEDDSIGGTFTQAGITGTFHLKRMAIVPQTATKEEPVPYKQEEVVFQNGEIKLAGTLTLPEGAGPFPAAVMLTGSGAQNRDEELFGFKPFKIIADHFTRKGIAVLRYDDRGVGGSTGSATQSTTADFAADALAAILFLKARSEINPKQIGLCGHSEGGIIAPLAASQSKDVAFIILMAGTALTGEKILSAQLERIMRADSASEEEIQKALDSNKRIYATIRTGENWDKVEEETKERILAGLEKMPADQRKSITNPEEFASKTLKAQLASVKSEWFKFFLDYDPAPTLQKVECPILALFGELDLQVPAEMNKSAMERTLKNGKMKDYTFKIFPKANHLFLTATTGSPTEYTKLRKEFVAGFLDSMSDWILARTTLPLK